MISVYFHSGSNKCAKSLELTTRLHDHMTTRINQPFKNSGQTNSLIRLCIFWNLNSDYSMENKDHSVSKEAKNMDSFGSDEDNNIVSG